MPYTNSKNSDTPNNQSSEAIRILHVVGGMDRGGVETWLMHILRQIDRDRFQMDFLAPFNLHYAYTEELQSLGSQIFSCDLELSRPWQYAANFKRILKDNHYDIIHVHVHLFSGYVLYLAKQVGVKIRIIHSHSDTSSVELKAGWRRRIYSSLMKWSIAKNATVGLAASGVAAKDLLGISWRKDPRWRILYCGIDLKPFHENVDSADIRAEFGIPSDALVIGHVGRFDFPKNHKFLIEIAAKIAEQEPNMRLLLLGIGPLRSEIQDRVVQLGLTDLVIFAGIRSDIPRIMKGLIDIFLFPSLYEGLCLVAMEAQAAGLPCIFSSVIAEEADIVKPLMKRVSLEKSADYWAEVVLSTRNNYLLSQAESLEILTQSPFNIQTSIRELTNLYNDAIGVP
jgi:glycosyltransferase involved in cell wall biosynthesis